MKKKAKKLVKKTTAKKAQKKAVIKKTASKKAASTKSAQKAKLGKAKKIKASKQVAIKKVKATQPKPAVTIAQPVKTPEVRFSTRVLSMGKTELERFRKLLESQLHELHSYFGRKYQNMNTTALPDINDQASAESERNFEIRIKDRERKLIGKVQEALKKVAEGTYGICESCGEAIGTKRLMARPVTNLCINCKAEMEADEKREESLMVSLQQSKTSTL